MKTKLYFDKGTIIVSSDFRIPHTKWDDRAEKHRALALFYKDIIDYLENSDVEFEDRVLDLVPFSNVSPDFELREYQKRALKKWMMNKRGVVVLPTGSGKTYVGMAAIREMNCPTFIVVPTLDLVGQWIKKLTEVFDIEVGEFTGRKKELKPITVSTYDSAYLNAENFGNRFKLLIFDECLVGDTNIVLNDGGLSTIKEIKNGSEVIGGLVSNKFKRHSKKLIHIVSSFSELKTTPTHPHIIVRRRRDRHRGQWFKVRENDVQIVQAKNIRIGDLLLIPKKIPHLTKREWTPQQLKFVALIACDGHIEKDNNNIKVAVRKKDEKEWIREVFLEGIKAFDIENFGEFVNSRGDYVIECCSEELKCILTTKFDIPGGKKSNKIEVSNEVFYSPLKSIKGFIDICFSSEGWNSINKKGSKRLFFSSTSREFTNKLQLLLKKFGIHSHQLWIRKKSPRHDSFRISVGNLDLNKLLDLIKFSRKNLGFKEGNKGKNMNDSVVYKGKKFRLAKVKEIMEEKGEVVYDFTSNGTETFLANGCLTHNCHHLPSEGYRHIAEFFASPYRLGLTATYERLDGLHKRLSKLIGGKVFEMKPKQLSGDYLANYEVKRIRVNLTEEEAKSYDKHNKKFIDYVKKHNLRFNKGSDYKKIVMRSGRDSEAWKAIQGRHKARKIAYESKSKIKKLKELLKKHKDDKVIIFTRYNDLVYFISTNFLIPCITYQTDNEERTQILSRFKSGKYDKIVSSQVLDEGIDVPDANVGIILSGTGSGREFIQRLGRILRPKKEKAVLYEIVSSETSELKTSYRRRKKID